MGGFRVAVGGLSHETNTFTPVATSVEDFRWFFADGAEMTSVFGGTNSPVGGFLSGAAEEGFDVVPTRLMVARPGGPVSQQGFDQLLGELLERLESSLPLDGVLLELHGAMASEGCQDCDGEILRRVRHVVGDSTPIVVQLDIHTNASQAMVGHADLLVGRRTYPEVDMADRGRDCALLLGRLLRERITPASVLIPLPLIWGTAQATGHGKMAALMERVSTILAEPDVLTACVLTGFRWADTHCMGSSVYVATSSGLDRARRYAAELADWIVANAESWYERLPDTAAAIELARAAARYPVVLADYLDNVGTGAAGDATGMLRAFITAGLGDACVLYIVDPSSVGGCEAAGAGGLARVRIGGHSHPGRGRR